MVFALLIILTSSIEIRYFCDLFTLSTGISHVPSYPGLLHATRQMIPPPRFNFEIIPADSAPRTRGAARKPNTGIRTPFLCTTSVHSYRGSQDMETESGGASAIAGGSFTFCPHIGIMVDRHAFIKDNANVFAATDTRSEE